MEIPKIHWSEVNGNPLGHKLSPLMLTEEGLEETRETRHKHSPKFTPCSIFSIHYGEDYVIEWVVTKLLIPLAFRDYNSFQSFISKCWTRYRELSPQPTKKSQKKDE